MAIQKTISFVRGKGNINHNNRKFLTDNIDKSRVKDNVTYIKNDLRKMYDEIFKDAVDEYNLKQVRSDRKIVDYYEKISKAKKEKLFHEVVVQIGDKDMNSQDNISCRQILDFYMKTFQKRNPNLKVVNAVMHLDEATPHLHIDFIPVATGYKKGMSVRNSISKSLNGNLVEWYENERQYISHIAKKYDIEIIQKNDPKRDKLLINEFKSLQDNSKRIKKALGADLEKIENYLKDISEEIEKGVNTTSKVQKLAKHHFEKTGFFGKKYYDVNDKNLVEFSDTLFRQINSYMFDNVKVDVTKILNTFDMIDKIDFKEISLSDYYLKELENQRPTYQKKIKSLQEKNLSLQNENTDLEKKVVFLTKDKDMYLYKNLRLEKKIQEYEILLKKYNVFELEKKEYEKTKSNYTNYDLDL